MKKISHFVAGRQVFIEVVVGPKLNQPIHFDSSACAFPIFPIGNALNINFGCEFLKSLGIPIDNGFIQTKIAEGIPFNDATALVYVCLSTEEIQKASLGNLQKVNLHKALLALYCAGSFTEIMRIQWTKPKLAHVQLNSPKYRRGLANRANDDSITPGFIY